jgi:gluconolactonase
MTERERQHESTRRRDRRIAKAVIILTAVAILAAQGRSAVYGRSNSPAPMGRIVRLDPRLDRLVPQGAAIEKIADGFTWVEGPAWDRSRGSLLFSDIPKNSVFEWREGIGARLAINPSGYTGSAPFPGREPGSNGLAFDREGRLVLCEHGDRRIARLEADGRKTTLVDRYQGKRLNSPSDLVVASNGDLYFTDPHSGCPRPSATRGKN